MLILPSQTLVVCGLRAEAALLPGHAAAFAGGDAARLEALLLRTEPRAVLSFGLAGGLDPALVPGTLIATACLAGEAPGDEAWARRLRIATGARGGSLAGAAAPMTEVASKAALFRDTAALAVDMESAVALRFARARGLPFAALRAVADTAGDRVPPAALRGLRPDGSTAPASVLRALLRRPGDLPGLLRLARHSARAMATLRLAAQRISA